MTSMTKRAAPAREASKAAMDPATLEMLWGRLRSAANEQGATIMRTAFSVGVRDMADYACAIFDARARLIIQADANTPGLCGSMGRMLAYMLKTYPVSELEEGDVLVSNNPWEATGHHNDITIYTPVFYKGKLIAFTASCAHHADIGGRRADVEARDNYEEGLRIPVSKLYRRGEPNRDVFAFIRANVRLQETIVGDMRAQVAANHVAIKRLIALCEEQGLDNLQPLADEIVERSRALAQATIRTLPAGKYATAAPIAEVNGQPVHLALTVEIGSDAITVDFTGSSGQLPVALNCTIAFTYSYTVFALNSILNLEVPINEGVLSCLRVTAPPGCLFNATFPAPVYGRSSIGTLIPENIYRALAPALPDRVIAGSGATPMWLQYFYGSWQNGKAFGPMNAIAGGLGARPKRDGVSCLHFPVNLANNPIENIEAELPVLCERRSLTPDSAGAGKFRGGFGQEFSVRVLEGDLGPAGPIQLSVRAGRDTYPVPGLLGGSDAPVSTLLVNDAPVPRWKRTVLQPGDVLTCKVPGGGGLGDPRERDRQAVADDVASGLVSEQAARSTYGYDGGM